MKYDISKINTYSIEELEMILKALKDDFQGERTILFRKRIKEVLSRKKAEREVDFQDSLKKFSEEELDELLFKLALKIDDNSTASEIGRRDKVQAEINRRS